MDSLPSIGKTVYVTARPALTGRVVGYTSESVVKIEIDGQPEPIMVAIERISTLS